MTSILDGLNDHQKCAVTSSASVLQVLAPPGSGKTKTLTTRVAYHIAHERFKPWNIIVCTFTIKAAREMKERIRSFVGDKLENKLVLGTFHSVARRYLAAYGHHIGIPKGFGIADTSDSTAIIKRIIKRHNFTTEASKARSRISRRKCGSTTEKPTKVKLDVEQQEFESIFAKYEESLQASNLLDYDDLLLRCAELLKQFPECVSNVEAVLIDEFQDTNNVQYELMSLFAQHRKPRSGGRVPSVTIVGDPDQSIYGFRMAEIKNLHRMRSQYPDTQVVLLQDNYRSSGSILHAAVEVIEQDESRPVKKLLATHTTGERPVLRILPSAAAEAAWIVAEVKRSVTLTAQLLTYSDYAILLRSAHLSRHIESALGRAGIPYRMVGGHKFFDRIEVKTLLDYLRVISQPEHNDALARIINTPSRKIGEVTSKGLLEEAEKTKKSFWNFILEIAQGKRRSVTKISAQAQKGLEIFSNIILTSQSKLNGQTEPCTVVDLVMHVIKKISYKEYLEKMYPEDFENRWANVEELVVQASEKSSISQAGDVDVDQLIAIDGVDQREVSEAGEALSKFLANVTLATAVDASQGSEIPNQLTISTIHAAKGLEWPAVFIPAAYQGSIPHSRAEDTDEERRLLYVGMTRAKCLLYLSWPKKSSNGESTTMSPFLTPRATTNCFVSRGPSMGFSVSQELARILSRDSPPEIAIQSARCSIERAEDDLWPEDGEEIPTENPRWNHRQLNGDTWTSNCSTAPLAYESSWKRQKTTHLSASVSAVSVLNSQDFSISNTSMISSGFVTASTHLKNNAEPDLVKNETIQQRDESSQNKVVKNRKKLSSTQGTLQTFFTKPSSTKQIHSNTINDTKLPAKFQSIKPNNSAFHAPSAPLQEVSNWKSSETRIQHTAISNMQASHKLKSAPAAGRPRKNFDSEEETATRYVLLSSSPVKGENGEHDARCSNSNGTSKENEIIGVTEVTRKDAGARFTPAATFHTTTMARLSSHSQGLQRRNLGMRRNVQGWGSQVNKPFSVPKRARD